MEHRAEVATRRQVVRLCGAAAIGVPWVRLFATGVAGEVLRPAGTDDLAFSNLARERLGAGLTPSCQAVLERYLSTYPGIIKGVRVDPKGMSEVLVGADPETGPWVPLEDGLRKKDHESRLNTADLVETLSDDYPAALDFERWPVDLDPGRYRSTAFLKAVYGDAEPTVRDNLIMVDFLGTPLRFNERNGAAAAFTRAGAKLARLIEKDPKLGKYFENIGGSFAWRKIAGTELLSAHSFGITVDLNPALGGYWRWGDQKDLDSMERRRLYPGEVVAAFESERIIWGGKWYHYDLMHFEFRPEMFAAGPVPPPVDPAPETKPGKPEKPEPFVTPEKPASQMPGQGKAVPPAPSPPQPFVVPEKPAPGVPGEAKAAPAPEPGFLKRIFGRE